MHGRLADEIRAEGEGAEELVIEVIAVGDDDDGGVLHGVVEDDASGVKRHGEAFAGALGVPDDADALVAGCAGADGRGEVAGIGRFVNPRGSEQLAGAQGLVDSDVDGVELVVAGHDLTRLTAAVILEDDEVADVLEEAGGLEKAVDEGIELGDGRGDDAVAGDGLPGHEALAVGGKRADAGFETVGDDEGFVVSEKRGNLLLVGLQLVEGGPDGGVLIGGVLELDDGEGQTVKKDDEVWAAVLVVLDDGELVDDEPVVVLHAVEIEEADNITGDAAIERIFYGDAIDEGAVELAVSGEQGGGGEAGNLAEGVLEGGGRDGGVEAGEGGAQAGGEDDLFEGVALGLRGFGVDILTVAVGITEGGKPVDGGLFDDGFGEGQIKIFHLSQSEYEPLIIRLQL